MTRSSKKGYFVDPKLLQKVTKLKKEGKKQAIRTWRRSSSISPEMISYKFLVHNGKNFIEVEVTKDMVGKKLGEFSLTRRLGPHGKAGTH